MDMRLINYVAAGAAAFLMMNLAGCSYRAPAYNPPPPPLTPAGSSNGGASSGNYSSPSQKNNSNGSSTANSNDSSNTGAGNPNADPAPSKPITDYLPNFGDKRINTTEPLSGTN